MKTEPSYTMHDIHKAKLQLSRFAKFPFRPHQAESIEFVMNSRKRFRIVKARTGFGKSLLAMVCGVMAGTLNYLVLSKFLQTQILSDFPEMVSIWGRSNYDCLADRSKMCNECLHTKKKPCPQKHKCLYDEAKEIAIIAPYKVLNFSYLLTEANHVGRFSDSPFTVIDEADSLENVLLDNIVLSFSERSLYQLGLSDGPTKKTVTSATGITAWKDFGKQAFDRATEIYYELKAQVDNIIDGDDDTEKLKKMRERDYFNNIRSRCKIFIESVDKTWLMEEIPRRGSRQGQTTFRPTWISPKLSEEYLWRHSHDWVLISATLPPIPVFCKQLGIDEDDIDYIEVPSTFDPDKAPVYIWPAANLTAKHMDEEVPKAIFRIRELLDMNKGKRGLIHTVSWKLCKDILEGVKSDRLVSHNSDNRNDVINQFMDPNGFRPDSVLVSPSCERGIDLKNDLCRFVIIVKTPFLSLGSKYVGARLYGSGEIGKLWYQSDAMTTIEQMAGRGLRSSDDHCVIYLIDKQSELLYEKRPSLFSDSFKEQISWDSSPWDTET